MRLSRFLMMTQTVSRPPMVTRPMMKAERNVDVEALVVSSPVTLML